MKLVAAVLGLGLLVAPAAFAEPGPAEGQGVYDMRCKMCHANGVNSAPPLEKLAVLDPVAVVEKLTTGTMAAMASGLSDEDKRNIAVYLTHKDLPASGDLPEVKAE